MAGCPVVVIIGGSRGIGLATALYISLFACTHHNRLSIVVTCRSESDCIDASRAIDDAVAESCGTEERVQIDSFAPLDVTNANDLTKLGAFLDFFHGGVDILVYAAGCCIGSSWCAGRTPASTRRVGGVSMPDVVYSVRVHCVGFWTAVEVLRPIFRRPGRIVAVTSFIGTMRFLPDSISPRDLGDARSMVTEGAGCSEESLIGLHGRSLYDTLDSRHAYEYSKNLQNLAVREVAANASADNELEVNAVCPGSCQTDMNPAGSDSLRRCLETIMWLAVGSRDSSRGERVHGGYFRYMKKISWDNGLVLADIVPDYGLRSWWDRVERSASNSWPSDAGAGEGEGEGEGDAWHQVKPADLRSMRQGATTTPSA